MEYKNLPKRDDDIYKEIENFEDYEFTQCVAFEMAIRNVEVIRLVNKLTDKFNNDDYHELTTYGLNYHELVDYGYLETYFFFNNRLQTTKKKARKVDILKQKEFSYFNKNSSQSVTLKNKIEFTQEYKKGKYSDLENVEDYEVYSSKAKIHHARPKLILSDIKTMQVEFDMNLSRDDVEAQFKHILDDYYKDRTVIKTALELLNEELEIVEPNSKMPKRNLKKVYADMLFIYDYIKECEPYFKAKQNRLKLERDREIEKVDNNKFDLDKTERMEQIDILRENYKADKKHFSLSVIKEEVEKIISSTSSIVEVQHKFIKECINDLKYKNF